MNISWVPWRIVGWDWTKGRQVQVPGEKCGSFVRSLLETASPSLRCAQGSSRGRSKTRTRGGKTLSQAFILLWYESKSFSEGFWLKVMPTEATITDLPVSFQTVCEERTVSPAFSTAKQAGRSETEWLTNFQMSGFVFYFLSPPSFTAAGCPFLMAVPWARGLLLLSELWLLMLHAAPEASSHNPWGTHLHLFFRG